jgi:rhodanese-related sulfurtransferase
MLRIIFVGLLLIAITANAQFKADNVKYKTVFPGRALVKPLMANQDYTLLDVRSQGEFDDTSNAGGLNIGHVKNSLHIDIRELPKRWKELLAYKTNRFLFIVHIASAVAERPRLLADSGFTKLYNVNGGLTDFYNQGIESSPCQGLEIVTTVPYKILSSKELNANVKQGTSYYIIDLRSDSIFREISTEKTKAEGHFNEAVNMPFEKLKTTSAITIPAKPILLVDEYGDESPEAAKLLIDKGYKDVSILFDGMDGWVDFATNTTGKPAVKWTRNISYSCFPQTILIR